MGKLVTYRGRKDGSADDRLRLRKAGENGEDVVLHRNADEPSEVSDEVAAQLEADEAYEVEVGTGDGPTVKELQATAAELNIEGRSSMKRDELAKAIEEARS